ncbi:MAG: tetratricopeptide repeat protein [Nitrospirales bacterium]|nr:tetratricopeptide repeat protein [Nitrospirales bacterium]MDR4489261.1 tetratricopeptide repeat protein [Nitrospirales bacterium]
MSPILSFLFPLLVILAIVLFALTVPFWRKDPSPISFAQDDDRAQEQADLQVERETLARSLQELEMEVTQGRMERVDYERLKATDERRLLQVLDRLEELKEMEASPAAELASGTTRRGGWGRAIASGSIVLLASLGIYGLLQFQQGQRILEAQERMGGGPNPLEMVAKLEARLKENPDDLQGQIMAGRSYQALDRLPEAKKAWEKVLELDPKQNEAHYNLGVAMIETRKFDDPELFKEALAHFDVVLKDLPNQPAVNWYRGLALWYLDRKQETDAAWTLASQNMEPGSKDAEFVKDALTKLRAGQVPF